MSGDLLCGAFPDDVQFFPGCFGTSKYDPALRFPLDLTDQLLFELEWDQNRHVSGQKAEDWEEIRRFGERGANKTV